MLSLNSCHPHLPMFEKCAEVRALGESPILELIYLVPNASV